MQIKLKIKTVLMLFSLLLVKNVLGADDSTTKKATETPTKTTVAPTTTSTTIATTIKPKIHVAESVVCKKCFCDIDNQQLDCSKRELKNLFTAEEWSILQNGDYTFETINFQHNNLTKISAIPAYPVSNLYLSFNQIDNITKAAFQNLTELTKLDLSHNKLTSKVMVPDVFKGVYSKGDYEPLGKMKELDLGYNELHNLDSDLFEHLPKLETLILCRNVFQVIDHLSAIAISSLTSLKTLDLSYMELKELPENFLHGPRELETLILSGNLLNEIPDDLELAVNLKELVLDDNLIGDISGDNTFPRILSLQYLSLSYMPEMTKIDMEGLSELQNLTTLIMTNNLKLSVIHERAFSKNTTDPKYIDYPPLKELYLHNNNLTILDRKLVERWDKISVIDLRYNPWICDSRNEWLINVLMAQINKTNPALVKEVTCASPAELKNLDIIDARVKDNLHESHSNTTGVAIACVLVAFLIGIPMVIGTIIMYRRGCLGLIYRRNMQAGAQYSRAESAEDLHI